ncbi:hypothetical protein K523DRAFT_403721, partial [Schizophyllum commune Tattone D]
MRCHTGSLPAASAGSCLRWHRELPERQRELPALPAMASARWPGDASQRDRSPAPVPDALFSPLTLVAYVCRLLSLLLRQLPATSPVRRLGWGRGRKRCSCVPKKFREIGERGERGAMTVADGRSAHGFRRGRETGKKAGIGGVLIGCAVHCMGLNGGKGLSRAGSKGSAEKGRKTNIHAACSIGHGHHVWRMANNRLR